LKCLLGRLTDYTIAHALSDPDRDEQYGRTRG
jgi:hypothetical protein